MAIYSVKPKDISRQWYVLDAAKMPLGRLSTAAASLLIGKGKTQFSHHIDVGDNVIIINAKSLITTGNKSQKKIYYRHSGFPGGLYKRTLQESKDLDASGVIRHSVRGMLPVNKLRRARLLRLKIYEGTEHAHQAQNPKLYAPAQENK